MKKVLNKLLNRRSVPSSDSSVSMGALGVSSPSKKKNPWGLLVAIGFVVVGILAGQYLLMKKSPTKTSTNTNSVALAPKQNQTTSINRSFEFAAYDSTKKLSTQKVTYTLIDAQKTSQIIIKGKPATAIVGRAFLIINLKITNTHNESLYLNTRNYIRIQPAGSQDKLAPEIHNDTVEIQPLSTKITRVGVPIDASMQSFTFFVGEIEDKDKQQIKIAFQ